MLSDVFSWAHSTHLVNRVDYRRALPIFRITSTYRADGPGQVGPPQLYPLQVGLGQVGLGQVGPGDQVEVVIYHDDPIRLVPVKPQPPQSLSRSGL